jgi:hypothetical protein
MNIRVLKQIGAAGGLSFGILLHTSAAAAATIPVRAGDNLQTAINAAQPGDTLLLDAGATFSGNFILPVKPGSTYITIRTASVAGATLPGATDRVLPSHSSWLAKIKSPNSAPAIATAPGSHHWRLLLLELPANYRGYGDIIQIGDGSRAQNTLSMVPHDFDLDRLYIHGDAELGQKRGIALNGAAVTIRNCYISDIKAVGFDTQAIGGWNGPGPYTIENNHLEASGENLLIGGADPGIANLVPTGVVVRSNYFTRPLSWRNPIVADPSGVTATAASGGSLPLGTYSYRVVAEKPVGGTSIARSAASVTATTTASGSVRIAWAAVPGATQYSVYGRSAASMTRVWTVSGTSFTDTGADGQNGTVPTGPGDRWSVKNLFELKNARNVTVEYNIFENNWAHAQAGYAILFTPRNQEGTCTWCVVSDVTFQSNIIRNVAAGFNILGHDNNFPSQQTARITIRNNLVHGMRRSLGGNAWLALISASPTGITFDHNTVDADGSAVIYVVEGTVTAPEVVMGFRFTNNAARHNDYGIHGTHFAFGNGIIANYFPDGVVQGNWLQGGTASRYPAGNYFSGTFEEAFVDAAHANFAPSTNSILLNKATDGRNIGADISGLLDATRKVAGGLDRLAAPGNLRIAGQ